MQQMFGHYYIQDEGCGHDIICAVLSDVHLLIYTAVHAVMLSKRHQWSNTVEEEKLMNEDICRSPG